MNNPHDNQLDKLLVDWANKTAVGSEELQALNKAVSGRLGSNLPNTIELGHLPSSRNRRRTVAGIFSAAAVLLIAFGIWRNIGIDGSVGSGFRPLPRRLVQYPHPIAANLLTIDEQRELLAEYDQVFGPELQWLVDGNERVDVGLYDAGSAKNSTATKFVGVQLVLFVRPVNENGQSWTQLESICVVAGKEQLVQVNLGSDGRSQLSLWAYPLDDELVSIDLRYHPTALTGESIDSSNLQRFGAKHYKNIFSVEKDGMEYRLYQTADLISDSDLG